MRKRRHPHQVMDVTELTIGARYAFVSSYRGITYQDIDVTMRLMVGVMSNTAKQASQRGSDLMKFQNPGQRGFFGTLPLEALLNDDFGPHAGAEIVTVHQDGWNERGDRGDQPTLTYWAEIGHMWRGWDHVSTYFGPLEPKPKSTHDIHNHCIVVPEDRWLADPRLHAAVEPDDVSPADFEQRMRSKRDKAMRRLLGYE